MWRKKLIMNEMKYIEIWEVSGNPNIYKLLAIPYTDSQCPTYSHLLELRDNIAERHNCKLIRLLGQYVVGVKGVE